MNEKPKKTCFVIAPIGKDDSPIRKRSDQVLKYVIAPVVESLGYTATRADQLPDPGVITSQILQRLIDDTLVVADLAGHNPNVFYEVGVRHAFRRPIVQLSQKGESIPFDVAGLRTIQLDHTDLDSVEAAKQELEKHVRALEADKANTGSPISDVIKIQALRRSDDPNRQFQAEVLSGINDLRASLALVDIKLGTLDATSDTTSLPSPILQALLRTISPVRAAGMPPSPYAELVGMQKNDNRKPITKLDEGAATPK